MKARSLLAQVLAVNLLLVAGTALVATIVVDAHLGDADRARGLKARHPRHRDIEDAQVRVGRERLHTAHAGASTHRRMHRTSPVAPPEMLPTHIAVRAG